MASTLAHRPDDDRRSWSLRMAMVAVLAAGVATAAALWAGRAARPGQVDRLGPTEAGTYRLAGTEHDSRAGATVAVGETYTVEPWFTRDGVRRQVTRFDGAGGAGHWETAFRPDGTVRLRESAGGVSWDWSPPLRTLALPLAPGRAWTTRSTAVVPDAGGVRRVTEVSGRTRVAGTDTVAVDGRSVAVLVLEARVTRRVTDTRRVDRRSTTVSSLSEATSWFSPSTGLVVRSTVTTTVQEGDEGSEPYVVTRRLALESLRPGRDRGAD